MNFTSVCDAIGCQGSGRGEDASPIDEPQGAGRGNVERAHDNCG